MSKLNKSIVAEFESAQITRELPQFSQGDTIVVNVKVKEGTSAIIDSVEVKRRGKVRAGKLYYLRGLEGKAARIKEDLAAAAAAKAARLATKG